MDGFLFIFCETVNHDVFYKVAVITLVETNFGRKEMTTIFQIGLDTDNTR
jgi:hypothetical protein